MARLKTYVRGNEPGPGTAARWHLRCVLLVLVLTFVTGGGSYDRGLGDALAQLAAIPLLVWSVHLTWKHNDRGLRWPLAVAGMVLAVVAVQCFGVPEALWNANPARAALLSDLARAGVVGVPPHWSLSPLATERGLWSVLPAVSLFVGALVLDRVAHRRAVAVIVGLVLASVVLGLVQRGFPQDSWLNVFPEFAPAYNGVFASPNHQATAIVMALMLAFALLLERRSPRSGAHAPAWQRSAIGMASLVLLGALPLTGSRAMAVVATLGLVAVAILSGVPGRALHSARIPQAMVRAALGAGIAVALAAAAAGVYWIGVDAREEVRVALAIAGIEMGRQLAPLGAGVGSFAPWFDQSAPDRLFVWEYFNHAHNEYVQWWVESGLLGLVAMAAALALFGWSRPFSARDAGRTGAVAVGSWVAVAVALVHSGVDYPLRTPALMAVTALLAGISVAAALAGRRRSRAMNCGPSGA